MESQTDSNKETRIWQQMDLESKPNMRWIRSDGGIRIRIVVVYGLGAVAVYGYGSVVVYGLGTVADKRWWKMAGTMMMVRRRRD